jgi:septum formation protein
VAEDLILASASPTRARLLAAAGIAARIAPASVDEQAVKQTCRAEHRPAIDCALALAEVKAKQVSKREDRALVVGADQILVCGGEWFDKPSDLGKARAQLTALRGRTHELATAVCVVQQSRRLWHTVSTPQLTMREFSDGFLDAYLAAEDATILGSVGAYRIEGRGVQLFASIEGDYFAILGLPLLELLCFLRSHGELRS